MSYYFIFFHIQNSVCRLVVEIKCLYYLITLNKLLTYSTTYHSRASECLQNIRGKDLIVFVLILFPQMSNILILKSVLLAQPQSSNKIMCLYYPYVVLYTNLNTYVFNLFTYLYLMRNRIYSTNLSYNLTYHDLFWVCVEKSRSEN